MIILCPTCDGNGVIVLSHDLSYYDAMIKVVCPDCGGAGIQSVRHFCQERQVTA